MLWYAIILCTIWPLIRDEYENSEVSRESAVVPEILLSYWISVRERSPGADLRGMFLVSMVALGVAEFSVSSLLCTLLFGYYSISTVILSWIVLDLGIMCTLVTLHMADNCVAVGINDTCSCCPFDEAEVSSDEAAARRCLFLRGSFHVLKNLAWSALKCSAVLYLRCRGERLPGEEEDDDVVITAAASPRTISNDDDDGNIHRSSRQDEPAAVIITVKPGEASKKPKFKD
jgi:hypothetical protein